MNYISKLLKRKSDWHVIQEKNNLWLITLIGIISIIFFLKSEPDMESFFLSKLEGDIDQNMIAGAYQIMRPYQKPGIEKLDLHVFAAASVEMGENDKFLFKKNVNQKLAIASLTKIMTAIIIYENYDLEKEITISFNAGSKEGDGNHFQTGETFKTKDLLDAVLMESSNKAATALAELVGEQEFVRLMNLKARNLGLDNTHFYNPTGLDPDYGNEINYSTIKDLVVLSKYLSKQPELVEIMKTKEKDIYQSSGVFHHRIKTTNELLYEMFEIKAGKTGKTPMAGQCLILILDNPNSNKDLVNIILGSNNNFQQMRKLNNWVYSAYSW